jgi:protein disulfide-isomerase
MNMKKVIVGLLAVFALMSVLAAEQDKWMTDFPKAQSKAKAEHKLVLMDFTGSDWCPWCIKLRQEVFDKREFKTYADQNLVLVEVDFPRRKTQTEEQKKANDDLQKKYKIEGYPTVIVLNEKGEKVGELGYEAGGPQPFIKKVDALKKKA